ncbi:MAG TPA: GNAT family N-acetyltransferase [Sphingobium sp.]|uniref:GNAT family N-acetyltransferase n=1 Tax=Sphingobium sp. TaxID=1912891 RepID=UPI002ED6ACFF
MLSVRFEPLPDLAALEPRWRALEAAAVPNFFTGWTWMGSWLRATGVRPELLTVTDAAGQEVALALIGRSSDKRLLGRVATLRLNEAGDAQADRAFIEYNAPLCRKGQEGAVAAALGVALAKRYDWRAMRLSGLVAGDPLLAAIPTRRKILLDSSPAYYADLEAVRGAGGDYLSLLSSNTRSQIKRSAKDYAGEAQVARAPDSETAAFWLEEMRALNTGRHEDNAWDGAVFRTFAAEIVATGMADGSVDLLRIDAGGALLGYLITFLSAGRAMNYQSAFAEPATPKSKPGLMAHAAAIRHYADGGYSLYSLLAGKDRYKQSLSTGEETLEWWMLERFSPVLEAEYWLRKLLKR